MPVLLRLAYDGTDLRGCPVAPDRRTVLGEVAAALGRVGVTGTLDVLSRTDAGVHARGQVAVLACDRAWSPEAWLLALDRHLPADLRCTAVALVEALPRVTAKTYTYTLDASPFGDPFRATRAWRVDVAVDALAPLADALVGAHDFSAFRRRGETREDLTRTVHHAAWHADGDTLVFTVTGDGFAYKLVRSLVGAMVCVARGGCTVDDLRAALAGSRTPAATQQAPARGLRLDAIALAPEPAWVAHL
ncbi:MAG: tRNA pseudouridine(38-40) synthase TruA [Alphaproteobacteria bacterium]|nr:tRNA pseudouridine(38-40) synthase TruA [Alphaproteobacteria bacterium]